MSASSDAAADYAALREDLAAIKADVMRLATSLGNSASENLDESARQLYGSATDQGNKAFKVVGEKFDEQPVTALMIAAAIGFIGAKLLSR
jgi:ElaB/YqjD/DUF883 family membrane-anchored ribosome-binding protein